MSANQIPVLTEEQYLCQNGAPRMKGADAALHRTPGGLPKHVKKQLLERVQLNMRANTQRREELRQEYAQLVEQGEIRPPTRLEKLRAAAAGDPLLERTQAARRLLEKHYRRQIEAQRAKIDAAYWAFSRQANAKPPVMVVPEAYAERNRLESELKDIRKEWR